jgi:ribonuclease Z
MEKPMDLAGTTIDAVSVGGFETCIQVPSWKLCFDIGRCPPKARSLPRVLFTHAHCDHMGGIIHHTAMRDLLNMSPPEYLVPAENEADFRELLNVWRRLDRADLPCTVRPVAPGDAIELGQRRLVRVFRAVHRVPCVGYVLCEQKEKLRAEFAALSSGEIRDLRHNGVAVTERHERPVVAFCGDTTIDVVDQEELVRKAKLLILEVTFLDDRVSVDSARRHGHIHLDEVIDRADRFENETILMTHFSTRYSRKQIASILSQRLPDSLRDRVVPLLPEPPWS